MHWSDKIIEKAWRLTKPKLAAEEYRALLRVLAQVPPGLRYRKSFKVPKQDGSMRLIRPASAPLVFVQGCIADWLINNFPLGDDYCYLRRRGVLAAVERHRIFKPRYGAVFDLKSAFDFVKSSTVKYFLRMYLTYIEDVVLDFIIDLITFQGHTPQGCVSTPYVYNLVIRPMDQLLGVYTQKHFLVYTRYSDNICFSSPLDIDFTSLKKEVVMVVKGVGFELNTAKTKIFSDEPIEYLGTTIYQDRIGLCKDKIGDILFLLHEALVNPTPQIYRRQINGLWSWALRVYQSEISHDLWQEFASYYNKVGCPPKSFVRTLNRELFC